MFAIYMNHNLQGETIKNLQPEGNLSSVYLYSDDYESTWVWLVAIGSIRELQKRVLGRPCH